MPRFAAKAYNALRPLIVPKACFQTVREVLEGLTRNQELISVLTGQWGDHGTKRSGPVHVTESQ